MNTHTRRFQGELAIRALKEMEPMRDDLTQPSSDPQWRNCVAADRMAMEKLFQDVFRSHPLALTI